MCSLLNSHPSAVALGELFSSLTNATWGLDCPRTVRQKLPDLTPEIVEERNADPVGFINRYAFGEATKGLDAAGFKFFYNHADFPSGNTALDWIIDSPNLLIIHLKRHHLLKTLLSKRVANRDGTFHVLSEEEKKKMDHSPIDLKRHDCQLFMERTLMGERELDYKLRNHATLTIYYEDLEANAEAVMAGILAFLSLPPQQLESRMLKQNTGSLKDRIDNYDELKAKFANSPMGLFFE